MLVQCFPCLSLLVPALDALLFKYTVVTVWWLYLGWKWNDYLGVYSRTARDLQLLSEDSSCFDLYTIFLQRCVHDICFYKTSCWCDVCSLVDFLSLSFHTSKDFGSLTMRVRERRSWTKEEDSMLRAAIKLGESVYQSSQPRRVAQ